MYYLIDLDGTIYRGDTSIPHAAEFIAYLNEQKRPYLLLTNCPRNTPAMLVQKLKKLGMTITKKHVLTAGQATAEYLLEKGYARVYLVGGSALRSVLLSAGLTITEESPDCVVVGYDKGFTYRKMRKAADFIRAGAPFIATNPDLVIPYENSVAPHTGAICASIAAAAGVPPTVIGKPEEYILTVALRRLGANKEDCCIIGDFLDTDILLGHRSGVTTYMVLTGVSTQEDLLTSSIQPTCVFENLKEVMEYDFKIRG